MSEVRQETIVPKRRLYAAEYRTHLEDEVTSSEQPINQDVDLDDTSSESPSTPEEKTFKKRYGDLRRYTNSLTERVKTVEAQLQAAQKKEIKIPSTKEELEGFARQYPDVFRHIRSIAMAELLTERENIAKETATVRDDLEKVKRERGQQIIMRAHPDFEELNNSEEFHDWAALQPKQLQDFLFESDDPMLCIKAIDLYKAEKGFKKKSATRASQGADSQVRTRTSVDVEDSGGKRVWKASEIGKLHPKLYEQYEDDIEAARREGRINFDA